MHGAGSCIFIILMTVVCAAESGSFEELAVRYDELLGRADTECNTAWCMKARELLQEGSQMLRASQRNGRRLTQVPPTVTTLVQVEPQGVLEVRGGTLNVGTSCGTSPTRTGSAATCGQIEIRCVVGDDDRQQALVDVARTYSVTDGCQLAQPPAAIDSAAT